MCIRDRSHAWHASHPAHTAHTTYIRERSTPGSVSFTEATPFGPCHEVLVSEHAVDRFYILIQTNAHTTHTAPSATYLGALDPRQLHVGHSHGPVAEHQYGGVGGRGSGDTEENIKLSANQHYNYQRCTRWTDRSRSRSSTDHLDPNLPL